MFDSGRCPLLIYFPYPNHCVETLMADMHGVRLQAKPLCWIYFSRSHVLH